MKKKTNGIEATVIPPKKTYAILGISKLRFVVIEVAQSGIVNLSFWTGTSSEPEMVQTNRANMLTKGVPYGTAMKLLLFFQQNIEIPEPLRIHLKGEDEE